jgi:hypothetical protein
MGREVYILTVLEQGCEVPVAVVTDQKAAEQWTEERPANRNWIPMQEDQAPLSIWQQQEGDESTPRVTPYQPAPPQPTPEQVQQQEEMRKNMERINKNLEDIRTMQKGKKPKGSSLLELKKGQIGMGATGPKATKIASEEWVECSPEEYRAALDKSPQSAALTDATVEQLKKYRCFRLDIDGKPAGVYYSIAPDGEMAGGINIGPHKGMMPKIFQHAEQQGGTWFNAWNVHGKLPDMYKRQGYEVYKEIPYNEAAAEAGYDEPQEELKEAWRRSGWKDGEPYPSVVYMRKKAANGINDGKSN